jgi:hypothetical protein
MGIRPSRREVLAPVESYFAGLRCGDLTQVPFAADIVFDWPLAPTLHGEQAVRDFLAGVLPALRGVRVRQHLVDGAHCATRAELDTAYGLIAQFEYFHVTHGRLSQVHGHFDPRPFTNPFR